MDDIGKRPDLLVFNKRDFDTSLGYDISTIDHQQIDNYVKKAVAGLEVRSSAFLIDKYEEEMRARTSRSISRALELKNVLLTEYRDLLEVPQRKRYIDILENITEDSIEAISFRQPSWRATDRLQEMTAVFKELKGCITTCQKRDYLSITPKVEDLKVVYKWAEKFNVPHYYFQVFFDKSFGISFKDILSLITDPDKEGEWYEISNDVKNQNKTTIKINTRYTHQVANKISEPIHKSVRREMGRGRLLFYVSFEGGTAYLDLDQLKSLLGLIDF